METEESIHETILNPKDHTCKEDNHDGQQKTRISIRQKYIDIDQQIHDNQHKKTHSTNKITTGGCVILKERSQRNSQSFHQSEDDQLQDSKEIKKHKRSLHNQRKSTIENTTNLGQNKAKNKIPKPKSKAKDKSFKNSDSHIYDIQNKTAKRNNKESQSLSKSCRLNKSKFQSSLRISDKDCSAPFSSSLSEMKVASQTPKMLGDSREIYKANKDNSNKINIKLEERMKNFHGGTRLSTKIIHFKKRNPVRSSNSKVDKPFDNPNADDLVVFEDFKQNDAPFISPREYGKVLEKYLIK